MHAAQRERERERSILEDQVQRLTRALAKTHDALTAKEAEVQRVQAELEVKEVRVGVKEVRVRVTQRVCLLTICRELLQALFSKHSQDAQERLEKSRSASDDVCPLNCECVQCAHARAVLMLRGTATALTRPGRRVGDELSVDEGVRVRVQMSHYARELQRERAAREKVAADLKALVGFEAGFSLFMKPRLNVQEEQGRCRPLRR